MLNINAANRIVILSVGLFTIFWFAASATSTPGNRLTAIRGGRHETFASIVFQFTRPPYYSPPVASGDRLHFNLFQATTALKRERHYRTFDAFVRLTPGQTELGVTIGIPPALTRVSTFVMKDPDRLVINFHEPDASASTGSAATDTAAGDAGRPPGRGAPEQTGTPLSRLQTIRGGRHPGYASVVFQFSDPVRYSQPDVRENEIGFTLFDATTDLTAYRSYKTFDAWVELTPRGRRIDVRIGTPEGFEKSDIFRMTSPHRLVANLYFEAPADTEAKATEPPPSASAQLPPVPPASDDSRQMALVEASILGRQGQHEKSLQIYQELLKRHPDDEEIWTACIEALIDAAHYEMAQSELLHLLQKYPGNFRAQRLQARLYMELRQYAWTFPVFDRLLNLNRADAGIWSDYAFASLDADAWPQALNYFSRVLEMEPDNREAFRSVHEILRDHRPRLDAGYRRYSQKSDDATIDAVSGRYTRHFSDRTLADIAFDRISVDRPESAFVPAIDETVNDALIRFRRRLTQNWEGRFGIGGYTGLGDGTTVQLGLDYTPRLDLTLHADFLGKRPWYDPVEAARYEGAYRQYAVSMDWTIGPTLGLFLGAEHWDYVIEGDRDYGTKNTFTGILTKRLLERPYLSTGYSYFFSDFDYENEAFTPIAMIPSESVHTLYGNIEHRLGRYVTVSTAGGLQRDVPRALSSWYILPMVKIEWGNRIESTISYEFNSESGTTAGGETQTLRIWNSIIF